MKDMSACITVIRARVPTKIIPCGANSIRLTLCTSFDTKPQRSARCAVLPARDQAPLAEQILTGECLAVSTRTCALWLSEIDVWGLWSRFAGKRDDVSGVKVGA
jgi:hypothetical protein